jgi:hypothetical protein
MGMGFQLSKRMLRIKNLGLSLVILNGAERSEESLRYPVASQGSRDFSLLAVAQNDMQAKVLELNNFLKLSPNTRLICLQIGKLFNPKPLF